MSRFALGFIASFTTAKHPGSGLGIFGGGVPDLLSSKIKQNVNFHQKVQLLSQLHRLFFQKSSGKCKWF